MTGLYIKCNTELQQGDLQPVFCVDNISWIRIFLGFLQLLSHLKFLGIIDRRK